MFLNIIMFAELVIKDKRLIEQKFEKRKYFDVT